MLLNVLYCFLSQLIILILFINETNGNTIDANTAISNDDDAFFRHIFKFLYENEHLFQSNCTSELQRLLTTSVFTNTTPIAIADITLTNITNTNTTINNTNNTIKYHKKEVWNKLHGRIHADRWDRSSSSSTTDATFQPISEIWNRRSGKRKETQFKRNFHGKIINNQKSTRSYRVNK
ncbi:hypothetical protein QQG55_17260 [Brugia pahangi]